MHCSPLATRAVRAALRETYAPACFIMEEHQRHSWDLVDNATLFDVSIVSRGSKFYGVFDDANSSIGSRRERPAVLRSIPWSELRELFSHLATAQRLGKSPLPLPGSLATAKYEVFAGVGRQDAYVSAPGRKKKKKKTLKRRRVALSAVAHHTLYVNGNTLALDSLDSPLRRALMAAVDPALTVGDVGVASGVRPWASSGSTESGLHFDFSDNFHCSLEGAKSLSLYPPNASARLYPVEFSHSRTPDYALSLRPSGELFSELVDVAWREDLIYSAVDEGKVDTERFPRFADAPRMQHTLSPGECVLIPAYWWHNLVSPAAEPNLALSFFFPNAPRPRVDYGAIYRWIGSVRDEVMPYLYWHREAKTHAARSAADVRAGGLHELGEAERAYAEEAAAAVQAGHQKLVELERTCPLVSEPSNRAAKPKSEL
jgi:hypothetical protein